MLPNVADLTAEERIDLIITLIIDHEYDGWGQLVAEFRKRDPVVFDTFATWFRE